MSLLKIVVTRGPTCLSKKHSFNDDEEAIFDEAVIYKRGEYWQMRIWLARGGKRKHHDSQWAAIESLASQLRHNKDVSL